MSKTHSKRIKKRSLDPLGEPLWDEEKGVVFKEFPEEKGIHLDSRAVRQAVKEELIIGFEKVATGESGLGRVQTFPCKFSSVGNAIPGSHKFEAGEIPQQLRLRAAKNWLKINKMLVKEGLCLIDAHSANFAIDKNSKLIWVDLGSIQPIQNGLEGIREYRSYYEFPLKIIARYPELSPFMRAGLDRGYRIYRRGYSYLTKVPVVQFKDFGLLTGFWTLLHRNKVPVPRTFIRKMSLTFLSLRLPNRIRSKGYWSSYPNRDSYSASPADGREKIIVDVVSKLHGSSILDVAGSDGRFLWLVRKADCIHLLTDTDDTGVSKFTQFISKASDGLPNNSVFTGLVRDFRSHEFKADIVLALAITHHLALSQWWSFESIADHLCQLTNKHVVVEFMPNGVGKYQSQYVETPDWYSLEIFLNELNKKFSSVTIVEETKSTDRILLICSEPNKQ